MLHVQEGKENKNMKMREIEAVREKQVELPSNCKKTHDLKWKVTEWD